MTELEIRHRVHLDGDRYVVTENFGPKETVWSTGSLAAANESIAKRKALLLEMIAVRSQSSRFSLQTVGRRSSEGKRMRTRRPRA